MPGRQVHLTLQFLRPPRPPRELHAAPPPRLPRWAPPADKVNGSLRPAHTEDTHWLPAAFQHSWVGPATQGVWPSSSDTPKGGGALSSRLTPTQTQSGSQPPPLDLSLRKLSSFYLQTWGKSCTWASSGPGLNISFFPSPTSPDPLTPGCRTDTQTLNEGQRSLNKEPATINTVQGEGSAGGSRSVVSASGLQGPARRVKRRAPGLG